MADLPTAGLKGDDALKDIAWLRKKVYDERTGINRAATEKRAHIGQLQQALPPKVKAADAETLVDQQIRLQQEEKQKQTGIQEDFNAAVEAAHTARAAALTELDAWYRPRREELAGKLAAARSLIEQNARADATLEAIKAGQKDIDKWDRLSERFTKALDSLDALRLSLFERLPVPGIELRDDGLYLDGVRWARQNTARKIAFALGVGVSRAERSEIKMICLDDAEHLDRKNLEALKKAALGLSEKGYQFFVSRVVLDGELTATTE